MFQQRIFFLRDYLIKKLSENTLWFNLTELKGNLVSKLERGFPVKTWQTERFDQNYFYINKIWIQFSLNNTEHPYLMTKYGRITSEIRLVAFILRKVPSRTPVSAGSRNEPLLKPWAFCAFLQPLIFAGRRSRKVVPWEFYKNK